MEITDLHCHSTASDGTVRPAEVVRIAKRVGLRAVALTDHDTFAGLEEAATEARHMDIELVPGCEISLDGPPGTFHMVGLLVDPADRVLNERLDFVRRGREDRNAQILEKLAGLGIRITQAEVDAEAGGDVVGRPHFARVLMKRGVVREFKEAFDRFLGKGRPAYAERDRLGLAEALAAIHGAGGVAVVAHPFTLGFPDAAATEEWFREAAAAGVDAVETLVTDHSRADSERWRALAGRHGMLESGGSDFHGENKKNTDIGSGKGSLRVPYAFLEAMKARAASRPRGARA